jgi:hypothetical protein
MVLRAVTAALVAPAVLVVWRVRPAGRPVRPALRALMVTVVTAVRPVTAARVVPVFLGLRV